MNQPSLPEMREAIARGECLPEGALRELGTDPRRAAQVLYRKALKLAVDQREEAARVETMLQFERKLSAQGFKAVAGVDEAGRGPLAGPIVAAAVILCREEPGLNDSKLLTPAQREALFERLYSGGHAIAVAAVDAAGIDRLGIQQANYRVMLEAVLSLPREPDFVLVDGFQVPGLAVPHERLIKGDRRSASIAAASIIAKVTRDRIMAALDEAYPQYGFRKHQGYGTQAHLAALRDHGPCPAHRRSFAPLAQSTETGQLFENA